MNFAITGVAGYIAPRHLKAIKETGNNLIAACDPNDSVGIIDSYFMDCSFFTEFERFDRHLEKLHRSGNDNKVDYLSICSPNHLHDAHIRLGLRLGADAICEKPLVIKPSNLRYLKELEEETGKKVYNILQLRVHPTIIKLKEKVASENKKTKRDVVLTYITSRGLWYNYSWKGNIEKSGGVATNIGIHFFDMLMWLFGKEQSNTVFLAEANKMSGFMELENANVRWFLSIDKNDLPTEAVQSGKTTFRSISIDGDELEFTGGFTDLHTVVYQDIMNGKGYGIDDAYPSIDSVYRIRFMKPMEVNDFTHPYVLKLKGKKL